MGKKSEKRKRVKVADFTKEERVYIDASATKEIRKARIRAVRAGRVSQEYPIGAK